MQQASGSISVVMGLGMTAAAADMARAGVDCSGWLFEPVTEGWQGKDRKRAEGIQPRPSPCRRVFVSAAAARVMGWIEDTAGAFLSLLLN